MRIRRFKSVLFVFKTSAVGNAIAKGILRKVGWSNLNTLQINTGKIGDSHESTELKTKRQSS